MLISEFSRVTGLSKDTIRFYLRKGLLAAQTGQKGANHPYQIFDQSHVQQAKLIRLAQSLGFTLREIADNSEAYRRGAIDGAAKLALMRQQAALLEKKATQIREVQDYFRAKIAWLEGGESGPAPQFRGTSCPWNETPYPHPHPDAGEICRKNRSEKI